MEMTKPAGILQKLPAELRNDIWTLVLLHSRSAQDIKQIGKEAPPALLGVCRQIRSEALLMWHSEEKYVYEDHGKVSIPFQQKALSIWLRSMKDMNATVKHLTLRFEDKYYGTAPPCDQTYAERMAWARTGGCFVVENAASRAAKRIVDTILDAGVRIEVISVEGPNDGRGSRFEPVYDFRWHWRRAAIEDMMESGNLVGKLEWSASVRKSWFF